MTFHAGDPITKMLCMADVRRIADGRGRCTTRPWTLLAIAGLYASPVGAQTLPMSDTEDAELGDVAVGSGRLHPMFGLDVRNGDFVRGSYDDDAASLDRVPVHAQIGLGYELHRDADGKPDAWIEARSSNGFHAPHKDEPDSPRAWYESNNLVGLIVTPRAASAHRGHLHDQDVARWRIEHHARGERRACL